MCLGHGWAEGLFEIADRAGAGRIAERLVAEGEAIPLLLNSARANGGFYREGRRMISTAPPLGLRQTIDPAKPLLAMKRAIVFENEGAVLSDIGDGVPLLRA